MFVWSIIAGIVLILSGSSQSAVRQINVEAERFNFSPSRIRVAVGEEVEIHLKSADTDHGFRVEGTEIDVTIPKRGKGEVVVKFKGEKPGRYKIECNRMCGAGHHFMRGELIVEAKGQTQ